MKKLIAIALLGCFTPAFLPQNSRAQVVESVVGASACAASVGCGVVVGIVVLGGVSYYVLNAGGRKYRVPPSEMQIHAYPMPQAGPRPSPRGDMRTEQETHGATTPEGCRKIAERFRRAGRSVTLVKVRRNTIGTGGVLRWECIFEGKDATPGWYGQ